MKDAWLIAGKFLDEDGLPKELRWIHLYFNTDVQQQFVRYVYLFDSTEWFTDHTGYPVSDLWMKKLRNRFYSMIEIYKKARADKDIEMIVTIESGNYKFRLLDEYI